MSRRRLDDLRRRKKLTDIEVEQWKMSAFHRFTPFWVKWVIQISWRPALKLVEKVKDRYRLEIKHIAKGYNSIYDQFMDPDLGVFQRGKQLETFREFVIRNG